MLMISSFLCNSVYSCVQAVHMQCLMFISNHACCMQSNRHWELIQMKDVGMECWTTKKGQVGKNHECDCQKQLRLSLPQWDSKSLNILGKSGQRRQQRVIGHKPHNRVHWVLHTTRPGLCWVNKMCSGVKQRHGVLAWCACVVCLHGVLAWCACMVCLHAMPPAFSVDRM